jgi:DKNYY family
MLRAIRISAIAASVLVFLILSTLWIKIPIADGQGGNTGYSENFWGVYFDGALMAGADRWTFHFLGYVPEPASRGDEFAADKSHVYFFMEVVNGADPATFILLPQVRQCSAHFACEAEDAGHYYYQSETVPSPSV